MTEGDFDRIEEEKKRVAREWQLCAEDPRRASPGSKFKCYQLNVDHENGDRATEVKLLSLARPHMRSLHCAWFSFFLAFTIWFSVAPLLKEIQDTLKLTKKEIWTSNITGDCTAIVMRMVLGPICDAYGSRLPMAMILVVASIPTAMIGLVHSATGLAITRLFIGIAGSSFVMAQAWPSRMFSRNICGTVNGIVGGWGNFGGSIAQLLVGGILFPSFTQLFNGDSERAWRTICIIPAFFAFLWGFILPFLSDDAPMGQYSEMKRNGSMDRIYMTTGLRTSTATRNTWILYIQYACSFGVELVMNNAAVLFFTEQFDLETEQASLFGFLFGSMNLVARGLGGYFSDKIYSHAGMRGRLWLQTLLLIFEGATIIAFGFNKTLAGSVVTMCIFSFFTQSAEGAIYGVVPYVSYLYTGSVAGLVGAGGNAGSVLFSLGFRQMSSYQDGFLMMGVAAIASSSLSCFVNIPNHAGLVSGKDHPSVLRSRQRISNLSLHGGDSLGGNGLPLTQEEIQEMGNAPAQGNEGTCPTLPLEENNVSAATSVTKGSR